MKPISEKRNTGSNAFGRCILIIWCLCVGQWAYAQQIGYQQLPLLLPSPLSAEDVSAFKYTTIVSHLEALQESDAIPPEQALNDLQVIIDFASETNQPLLEIQAATVKVLIHNALSQAPEVERLVNIYLPQVVNASAIVPLSRMYRAMLNVALIKGEADKRVAIKRQLLHVIDMDMPERHKGLALLSLGTSDFFAGQYFSSLQYLGRAQDIFVRNELRLDEDRVLSILAIVNSRLGNEKRAIDLQLQIAERMRLGEKTLNWSVIDFNIASAYFDLGDLDNARIFVARSRKVAEELVDAVGVAYANELMAKIDFKQLRWAAASRLARSAAETFADNGDSEKQADALITLASAHVMRNELSDASAIIEQLESLQQQLSLGKIDLAMLKLRSLYAEGIGNTEQALALFKQYHTDFTEGETQVRAVAVDRLMAEFTVDAQQSENRYLAQQNALKQAQIARQEQQQTTLILGIVLVSIIVCGIVVVVIVQWRKNLAMHDLALTDELTGAPNRRACFRSAKLAFNRSTAGHYPLVVAVVDLDHFKEVNDRLGHEAGDKVLCAFASAVKSVLRDQDTYGRMGGEEWLIVFPHADVAHVNRIFKRLRKAYQLKVSKLGIIERPPTFSMGAVSSYGIDSSVEGMITRADKLVYQAKAKGRDCLVV